MWGNPLVEVGLQGVDMAVEDDDPEVAAAEMQEQQKPTPQGAPVNARA